MRHHPFRANSEMKEDITRGGLKALFDLDAPDFEDAAFCALEGTEVAVIVLRFDSEQAQFKLALRTGQERFYKLYSHGFYLVFSLSSIAANAPGNLIVAPARLLVADRLELAFEGPLLILDHFPVKPFVQN